MTNRPRSAMWPARPDPAVVRALWRATGVVGLLGALVVGLAGVDAAPPADAGTRTRVEVSLAATEAATGPGGGAGARTASRAGASHLGADGHHPATDVSGAVPVGHEAVLADLTGSAAADRAPAAALASTSPSTSAAPRPQVTSPEAPPPTTVPAAPAPATRAAPPAALESVIRARFGELADQAIAVARCESGFDPSAVSPGRGNWGLFQINVVHRDLVAELGYEWEDLIDAEVNTHVARVVYARAGDWSPWACRP